jgi:hypothetical protein
MNRKETHTEFTTYLRNPAYRRFVRSVREAGVVPDNLDEYFGYGMYVGRKKQRCLQKVFC